jgi:hypothetical protein
MIGAIVHARQHDIYDEPEPSYGKDRPS